jgi:thiosulfate/3-mercaptopyruvate sulfurtransferase
VSRHNYLMRDCIHALGVMLDVCVVTGRLLFEMKSMILVEPTSESVCSFRPSLMKFYLYFIRNSTANTKNLPHMKPSGHQFSVAMDILNITPGNTLYVYANNGCGFAHRAYWTLSSFHDPSKVKLVQGSLEEWKSNGGALDDAELDEDDERMIRMPKDWQQRTPKYKCRQVDNTVDMDQMLDFVTERTGAVIVDARSHGRFVGKDPEPRPGLRGGHMPNALNVPFVSLLDDNDMTKFKPLDQVKEKFIEAGIKPIEESSNDERKVVCSCGSGVTAAALAVGLVECGLREKEDVYIYDGSWIEWGGDDNTPIDKDE